MPAARWAALFLSTLLVACGKPAVEIQTPLGPIRGFTEAGSETYLGIPYARPPVGDLRWRSPQPVAPWREPLDATGLSPSCPQFAPPFNMLMGEEDCLYLNVWAPVQKPAQPMPVMVWIHGGGFTAGKAAYTPADGQKLAVQTGTVVVAMNYRLGVFGFLADRELSSEDPAHPVSGNYGIEDQAAALRWVRDNIAAFGGDPANVTIFGQSAGGVSVCAQLASPASAGLFQRAIIQSGPCATPLSKLEDVSVLGQRLGEGLGCNDKPDRLACMRGKPAAEVAEVLPPDPSFAFGEGYTVWWPVLDGRIIPEQFEAAFAGGRFNKVPVINGATLDEGSLIVWLSHNFLFKPLQPEQYLDRLEYLVGDRHTAELVAAQYPLGNYSDPFEALTEAFSDGFFNCQTRNISLALSRQVPVWAYQFDYREAPFFIPGADLKAFHAAEIQYIFANPMSVTMSEFEGEQGELSRQMMGLWTQFARSGDPNRQGLAPWPRFEPGDRTLLFDADTTVATHVHRGDCNFWDRIEYLRAAYP